MSDLVKIPEDLKERWSVLNTWVRGPVTEDMEMPVEIGRLSELRLIERIAQQDATLKGWLKENGPGGWIDNLRKENETLKGLLREWRNPVKHSSAGLPPEFADLCKRTDQQLQPKGGEL